MVLSCFILSWLALSCLDLLWFELSCIFCLASSVCFVWYSLARLVHFVLLCFDLSGLELACLALNYTVLFSITCLASLCIYFSCLAILSCLDSSLLNSSHIIMSCFFLSWLIFDNSVLSCLILYCFSLFGVVFANFLLNSILQFPALSCFALSIPNDELLSYG